MSVIIKVTWCIIAIMMIGHGIIRNRGHLTFGKFGHSHGGSMIAVDYYAYASRLRPWNASFKVLFSLVCLILCIALNNVYVSLAVIITMAYLVVVHGELAFDHYFSMMTVPILFLIAGSLAIAVGFSLTPYGQYHVNVFHLFYIYCSDESLHKTFVLIFKALAAVSALYMMTLTTPLSELIIVLRKIHTPKLLVELMNMIYRYIFIMLGTHTKMKESAESRLGFCDFKTSCYSFGQIASNLLVVSLKKGNDYYNALEARCYDGDLRFYEEDKPFNTKHNLLAFIYVIALLITWYFTK